MRLVACAGLAALLAAVPAHAQLDSTLRPVMVLAGPDEAFPQVARLQGATNVHVHGCLESRTWCDVQAGRTRGWVRPGDLAPSPRVTNAATVTFSVADYWDAHYRRRPWYADRERWLAWGTPGFVAPGRTPR